MTYPMLVTAAIIEKDGKYLFTQRPEDGRHLGGSWEFPGGKVDFGEDPRQGLEREIEEELGIKIKAGEIFECSSRVYDGKKHVVLLGFHCKYISGEIKNKDIQDHTWLIPGEMWDYKICEADSPFIEKLIRLYS